MKHLTCKIITSITLLGCLSAVVGCGPNQQEKDEYLKVLQVKNEFDENLRRILFENDNGRKMSRFSKKMLELRNEIDIQYDSFLEKIIDYSEKMSKRPPQILKEANTKGQTAYKLANDYLNGNITMAEQLHKQYVTARLKIFRDAHKYKLNLLDEMIAIAPHFRSNDTFDNPEKPSLFGISLGQVIDYKDPDVIAEYGIHLAKEFKSEDIKYVTLFFIPQQRFMDFDTYIVNLLKETKEVVCVGAVLTPYGEDSLGKKKETCDSLWHMLTTKFSGEHLRNGNKGAITVSKNVVVKFELHEIGSLVGQQPPFSQFITLELTDVRSRNKNIEAL